MRTVLSRCLLSALVLIPAASRADERPTNFVVFLTDDLGWGDLACYGHPIMKTPHLDAFAKQGIRFTQCYSACGVCSPSRSAILTGRTPYRNGVYRWIPETPRPGSHVHLRASEITIPKLLKGRGYQTCHVGKWHLNGAFNSPEQPQPNDHGFDHWFATQNNASPTHKDPKNFVRNGEAVGEIKGYSALICADEAARWLSEKRDRDAPFYLQVWTHEPHLPIESDPEFMNLYPPDTKEDVGLRQHHGNVTQLDAAFGRLMKALDDLGLADDTFVIFTSDNGPEGNGRTFLREPDSQRNRTRGSTGGLRGRKRDDYEGGIRVPGIVRWPGRIEAGTVSHTPVVGTDIFATVCEIAGVPLPDDRVIDAASMLPAFKNEPIRRAKPLYWRTHISSPSCRVALRIDDWKIVANADLTKFELYNMREDWQELEDQSAKEPERFAELKQAIIEMNREVFEEGPDWWKDENQK